MATALVSVTNGVVLRPAGQADLPALARLYVAMAEAHGERMALAAAEAKLGRMLASPAQQAVLFERGGLAIGYVLWADLGDHVFIRGFALAPEVRGQGLGRALWQRFHAEILPPKPVRLEVVAPGPEAFWRAMGFASWSTGMRTDHRSGAPDA
ncbi:MAG: GNAT family N-acetyltransferase [Pikeienuella sp.]